MPMGEIQQGPPATLGDWRIPYKGGSRVPYTEPDVLYGGGSTFNQHAHHHPQQQHVFALQERQIDFHEGRAANAELKTIQSKEPKPNYWFDWGDIGSTAHLQHNPTIADIEAKIKRKMATKEFRQQNSRFEMPYGAGSAHADVSGIPTASPAVHHSMTGKANGLRANVHYFEPSSYEKMCKTAMASRRESPSYAGAPQAARRTGVFYDAADGLDAHQVVEGNACKATMYQNNLSIEQVKSYQPVDRQLPHMMLELNNAQTLRALGDEAGARQRQALAERTCPGIVDKYRMVGWPADESVAILQSRLTGPE